MEKIRLCYHRVTSMTQHIILRHECNCNQGVILTYSRVIMTHCYKIYTVRFQNFKMVLSLKTVPHLIISFFLRVTTYNEIMFLALT